MTTYGETHHSVKKLSQTQSTTAPTPEPGTFLSDIQELQLHWLWEKRILRGKLTLLDGDPDLGKSLITLDLAARVTTGKPMPDGTPGIQGNVILIAPEDDAADTIKPRVLAAGGDPSRIRLLNIIENPDSLTGQASLTTFTLPTHLFTLIQSVKLTHAVLVIIDPLIAVLDRKISASRDQDMRRVLSMLALLARHTDCAFLLVRHLNKGSLNNPLYRGSGSIGIIASARSGLLVVRDPNDENKRILTTSKNNLSTKAPNLTYQITSNSDGLPIISWLGASYIPLSHLLKNNTNLSSGRQAILNVLQDSDIPLGPKNIAEQTGQKNDQVRLLLRRMHNDQEIISPAYGLYTVPGRPSPNAPSPDENTVPETVETENRLNSNLFDTSETLETVETVETLETVNYPISNLSVTSTTPETVETVETVETLETVSHPDSNFSDTSDSPDTVDTLKIVKTYDLRCSPDLLETLDILNPLQSNVTHQPIAPTPAQIPVITQETLDIITKKIRSLFYCTHDNHYDHWLIFTTKIGCPLCDGWLVKEAINNPSALALYEILNQHPPRENELRRAWLDRLAPFIP